MGGEGSGRKPDVIKMANEQSIRTTAPAEQFELPNYSGLRQEVKKNPELDNDMSGSAVMRLILIGVEATPGPANLYTQGTVYLKYTA